MKISVVVENTAPQGLFHEWGLSLLIEYNNKKYLLDAGQSDAFKKNMEVMNIDINDIDIGVLSHAHYDHSNGIPTFFKSNNHAKFFLRSGSAENCYGGLWIFRRYVGIKKGTLKKYKDRIVYALGDYKIDDGVFLIPHKTSGLEEQGRLNQLYIRKSFRLYPDNFSHEQSLVFDTEKGLVVFNSCSHGGADVIIKEIRDTFPGKNVYAIIGGFHLYRRSEKEVREFANRVKETGIQKVITGHCTGLKAYNILKDELGELVEYMNTGLVLEI